MNAPNYMHITQLQIIKDTHNYICIYLYTLYIYIKNTCIYIVNTQPHERNSCIKGMPGLDHGNIHGRSRGGDQWLASALVSTRGSSVARRRDGGGHGVREDVVVAMGGRGAAVAA